MYNCCTYVSSNTLKQIVHNLQLGSARRQLRPKESKAIFLLFLSFFSSFSSANQRLRSLVHHDFSTIMIKKSLKQKEWEFLSI